MTIDKSLGLCLWFVDNLFQTTKTYRQKPELLPWKLLWFVVLWVDNFDGMNHALGRFLFIRYRLMPWLSVLFLARILSGIIPGGIADLLSARIPMESASNAGDSSDSCPMPAPRGKPYAPNLFGFFNRLQNSEISYCIGWRDMWKTIIESGKGRPKWPRDPPRR